MSSPIAEPVERAYAGAFHFARIAHMAVGQKRKYTGEPYHYHCVSVAERVRAVMGDDDPAMIKAALLHDVLEDTHVTFEDLVQEFGNDVATIVWWLTEHYTAQSHDLNRAQRKEREADRLAGAPVRAKNIKLGDITDNLLDIATQDRAFARVYVPEKATLVEVLHDADEQLLEQARDSLEHARSSLEVSTSRRKRSS